MDRSHRAVIALTGADRRGWLHSISTCARGGGRRRFCTENLSLDGRGQVEDHWLQTELGDVTYLDTRPGRGEPLLTYLKMVWSDVAPVAADVAVLSLLGPG